MSSVDLFHATSSELTTEFNKAKDLFLDALVSDEITTKEKAEMIKKTYAVVVAQPSWFGRAAAKLSGKDVKHVINIVKVVR